MLRIVLISFYLFLCFGVNDSILWSDNYKLTWQNFKANPKPEIDAVALTVSGISFSYSLAQKNNADYTYKTFVKAHFYPEKSWFKTDKANDYILSHEQLHFDITELYARKLRKRIKEAKFTKNIRSELNQINDEINSELDAFQNKYDKETNHSINTDKQKQWDIFVVNELGKYSEFSEVN